MKQNTESKKTIAADSRSNDETFNEHLTAIPKKITQVDPTAADEDLIATEVDFGEMNAADAKVSGYTDADGHAVSLAKKDKAGSPTGAYTDIGAGRSSAVVRENKNQKH